MANKNVTLTPEMESLVAERVASGKYRSAEEVVKAGLHLLKEHEELGKPDFVISSVEELEIKLREGIESLDRGEGIPAEVSYARVMKQLKKKKSQ